MDVSIAGASASDIAQPSLQSETSPLEDALAVTETTDPSVEEAIEATTSNPPPDGATRSTEKVWSWLGANPWLRPMVQTFVRETLTERAYIVDLDVSLAGQLNKAHQSVYATICEKKTQQGSRELVKTLKSLTTKEFRSLWNGHCLPDGELQYIQG
jgi:hypothetical protein